MTGEDLVWLTTIGRRISRIGKLVNELRHRGREWQRGDIRRWGAETDSFVDSVSLGQSLYAWTIR